MKFRKRLKKQIQETLPEWKDEFLSYKDLKKLVKLITLAPVEVDVHGTKAEADFIRLLNVEIEKFNTFFLEQEENFIIRRKEIEDRIQEVAKFAESTAVEYKEIEKIKRDIVNLHGEMVLLENYSNINYTGLAKIIKKYNKQTGRLLRLPFIDNVLKQPFIDNVLKQPFFMTDLISKLIKECEKIMDSIFPVTGKEAEITNQKRESVATVAGEQGILRNTVAALMTMQELRRGSSTYSHFSLPPLDLTDTDSPQPFQPPSPFPIQ